MFISFSNIIKKIFNIIFTLTFLYFISSDHSLASNHTLAVEELEISKEIDLEFSRIKIIDEAFKKAFYRLLSQILNSTDIKKLKNVDMREIKTLVENFKIKNEIFRESKYYANFDVYFNKKKIKFFLEKKNLFYSNPKQISVLFLPIIIEQENFHLFNDNIFNNIAYGMPDATLKDVISAAEAANALEFIERLPEKFDTEIGEKGTRLSGGQRQRLSIARAILKNPEILILDEATSALDTESERKVQLAIDNLVKDRTVLVIAHRLSTIVKANRIIVLDNGKIVESGNHQELLDKNGHYKKLYDIQFGDIPQQ